MENNAISVIFSFSEPWYWKMQTIGMQMMEHLVGNCANMWSQRKGRKTRMKGSAALVMRQSTRCESSFASSNTCCHECFNHVQVIFAL